MNLPTNPAPSLPLPGAGAATIAALKTALHRAEMGFDLLAEYGLEGESYFICYGAMKMIAATERDKAREALRMIEQPQPLGVLQP